MGYSSKSVWEPHSLYLEHESKIKKYMQHLGQTLIILHKFAQCRSFYTSDEPLHLFQPGERVLLNTWKTQGPERQLAEQFTHPCDIWLIRHLSLRGREDGGNIGGSGVHFPSTPGKYVADLRSRANSQQYSSIYEDQRPKIEDIERSDGKKSA